MLLVQHLCKSVAYPYPCRIILLQGYLKQKGFLRSYNKSQDVLDLFRFPPFTLFCSSLSPAKFLYHQDWTSLFENISEEKKESDFPWLSTMLTDHLTEVRWCGLSIATHILQQTASPLCIKQEVAGGLWNIALIIAMDGKECCLVRDQVNFS